MGTPIREDSTDFLRALDRRIERLEKSLAGGIQFPAKAAADVGNNELFRDLDDDKLKFKDNMGDVNALYFKSL